MAFSLQRTNPRLTGNIKLVVTDQHEYLESIDSSPNLSRSVYKAAKYNLDMTYGQNVRSFASKFTNIEDLYSVLSEDTITVSDDLSQQYHTIYDYGCYSNTSKQISKSFRFFAPLCINEKSVADGMIPSHFIVIRLNSDSDENSFSSYKNALKSGTIVADFDISKRFAKLFAAHKDSSIDFIFDEDIIVNGISVSSGQMSSIKDYSDVQTMMSNERTLTEFNNQITNLFKDNALLYSNIINFEFMFDDDVAVPGFYRYVGFYVNLNKVDKETALAALDSDTIVAVQGEHSLKSFNRSYVLEKYKVVSDSMYATAFASQKPPRIKVKVLFNPAKGEKFELQYGNTSEISIEFNDDILARTANDTQANLLRAINEKAKSASSISVSAFAEDGHIVIQSNVNDRSYESIRVIAPKLISVQQPLYSKEQYDNTFYCSSEFTITSSFYHPIQNYNSIRYIDNDGNVIVSEIVQIAEAYGQYIYKLDSEIVNKSNTPDSVWFVADVEEHTVVCSVIDHRTIDFDTSVSKHNDVLDFDIDKFYSYLLDIVNSDEYRGRLDSSATEEEVAEYKNTIRESLSRYFSNITADGQFLINNLDLVTLEASTVSNEYDRLSENTLEQFIKINKLYKFINRWTYAAGTDVFNNDYLLNIALPFRYDNFSPSIVSADRDMRYHTHSWLILAEGKNPYLGNVTADNVNKHLSYSAVPMTVDMLKDTSVDAYNNLSYSTEYGTVNGYSSIQINKSNGKLFTFFRGLYVEFKDPNLENYRFSAILLSKSPTDNDKIDISAVQNDTFKTFTLVCKFYIPDPILTSLELDKDQFYYLDRSLLYFSNEIYSTTSSAVDFGQSNISVILYDTSSDKTFLNAAVNRNSWYHTQDGINYVYVKRGDLSRFSSSFSDVISVGEDLTIFMSSTDETTDPNFGIEIIFRNIQEVADDFFWCLDITIRSVETAETNDPKDPSDNDVVRVLEFNVLEEFLKPDKGLLNQPLYKNLYYISRSVAYENAKFQKIVRATSNVARYRELSTANIAKHLNDNTITVVDTDNRSSRQKLNIIPPSSAEIVVSMESVDNEIRRLQNKYVFPIIRYSGKYIVYTSLLNSYLDSEFGKNTLINKMRTERRELQKMTTSEIESSDTTYADHIVAELNYSASMTDSRFYYISENESDDSVISNLPWIACPIEYRSFTSIVLNSSETITVTTDFANTIDTAELLYDFSHQILRLYINKLSNIQKLEILKYIENTSEDTADNYDIDKILVNEFVSKTFYKLYSVKSITVSNQTIPFYMIDTFIMIDSNHESEKLEILFARN